MTAEAGDQVRAIPKLEEPKGSGYWKEANGNFLYDVRGAMLVRQTEKLCVTLDTRRNSTPIAVDFEVAHPAHT